MDTRASIDAKELRLRDSNDAVARERRTAAAARRRRHVQTDALTALGLVEHRAELRDRRDLLTLDLADYIAFADIGFGGGRDSLDVRHEHAVEALADAVQLARLRGDVLNRHAQTVAHRLFRSSLLVGVVIRA